MLDRPSGVEAELVGEHGLLECVCIGPLLRLAGERCGHRDLEEDAEPHPWITS